jgi:hypothetical protein
MSKHDFDERSGRNPAADEEGNLSCCTHAETTLLNTEARLPPSGVWQRTSQTLFHNATKISLKSFSWPIEQAVSVATEPVL